MSAGYSALELQCEVGAVANECGDFHGAEEEKYAPWTRLFRIFGDLCFRFWIGFGRRVWYVALYHIQDTE